MDISAISSIAGPSQNPVDTLERKKKGVAKSRTEKVQIQGFFPPGYRKAVKMLSVSEETTIEALLQEAMDDLFKKRGVRRP